MNTKIVYSEKCLGYGAWHVEGPQRVKVASEILKDERLRVFGAEACTAKTICFRFMTPNTFGNSKKA